jgi:hypothetical protein
VIASVAGALRPGQPPPYALPSAAITAIASYRFRDTASPNSSAARRWIASSLPRRVRGLDKQTRRGPRAPQAEQVQAL